jgi:hypothetical protein
MSFKMNIAIYVDTNEQGDKEYGYTVIHENKMYRSYPFPTMEEAKKALKEDTPAIEEQFGIKLGKI